MLLIELYKNDRTTPAKATFDEDDGFYHILYVVKQAWKAGYEVVEVQVLTTGEEFIFNISGAVVAPNVLWFIDE